MKELHAGLALYERLLRLDGWERQLAQLYLWEKWGQGFAFRGSAGFRPAKL